MKLLIIEDDIIIAEAIKQTIAENFGHIEVSGTVFSTSEALKYCYKFRPDMLIMDIKLGYNISFELFEYVDPSDFSIIFLCDHKEFALEAIHFGAVAYILKPIDLSELIQSIDKAEKQARMKQQQENDTSALLNASNDIIYLSENHTRKSIRTEMLVKIHSDGSYSKAYLTDGKTIHLSRHLGFFQHLLADKGFIRTHRKSLVNNIHIVHYYPGIKPRIKLSDGTDESIARTKKQLIIQLLARKN